MKYTTAVLAFAAATVYAQVDTVTSVIGQAQTGVEALDKAGKAFSGDVAPVKSKADDLVSTLKAGKAKVDALADGSIKLADAIKLATPVQDLAAAGSTLEKDFKAQIPAIEKAKACSTVRTSLSSINDASQALIKSVTSKVETVGQSTAQQLADSITKVLTQAQSDFSESNCKDGSGGGSSPSGGASSAAASGTGAAPSSTGAAPAPSGTSGSTEPCHVCQGGNGTQPSSPGTSSPVTAGASLLAPAGALAVAIAAALL